MEKVLIIAYQFPPMGGSGVQRTSKFVKHLKKFGFTPIVFTRKVLDMKLKDETLLLDIPKDVKVYRSNPYDLAEKNIIGKIIARKLLIPDGERLWELGSRKHILRIIEKEKIKLIYTTSSPYSAHLLGLFVKRKCPDIKWAADFRDEWTNNPYTLDNPHNSLRTALEKKMEKAVLSCADSLITNTPVMRRNFIQNGSRDFYVIPNGYDEEDFLEFDKTYIPNKIFTITYTGALYGRRKPDYFFEALAQLIQENKIPESKIKVRLIGNYIVKKLNATIAKHNLTNVVEIISYMPHKECIGELLKSDCLLLLEGGGIGSDAFYTGKIFEYMNTNRPVLAVLPKGAASGLVEKTNIGLVSLYTDIPAIKNSILQYYHDWENKNLQFSPNYDEIIKFERKVLTKELAHVLNQTLRG